MTISICPLCGKEYEKHSNQKSCKGCAKKATAEYKHNWYIEKRGPRQKQKRYEDLSGEKYGRWTVLEVAGRNDKGNILYKCRCDCGKEKIVSSTSLRDGSSKSCGCLQKEKSKENLLRYNSSERYKQPSHTTHGMRHTRLYRVWCGMKKRCNCTNYEHFDRYGGRNIRVCEEWSNDFQKFADWALKSGYKDDLSIDRIDVEGNYTPENCRWATIKMQARNKENTLLYEHEGVTKPFIEWCENYGVPYKSAHARYRKGKSFDEIFKVGASQCSV